MERNEFIAGYLAAVQFVAIGHNDTAISEDMIRNSGFSEKDLLEEQKKCGFCDDKMIPIIKAGCSKKIFKRK